MKKIKLLEKNYSREITLPETDSYGDHVKYRFNEYRVSEIGDKLNEIIKTVNLLSEAKK